MGEDQGGFEGCVEGLEDRGCVGGGRGVEEEGFGVLDEDVASGKEGVSTGGWYEIGVG